MTILTSIPISGDARMTRFLGRLASALFGSFSSTCWSRTTYTARESNSSSRISLRSHGAASSILGTSREREPREEKEEREHQLYDNGGQQQTEAVACTHILKISKSRFTTPSSNMSGMGQQCLEVVVMLWLMPWPLTQQARTRGLVGPFPFG